MEGPPIPGQSCALLRLSFNGRAQVLAAMRSPETDARMEAARGFMMASDVQATPTMIVNGRYRVVARSYGDLLRITDLLVARERAAGRR